MSQRKRQRLNSQTPSTRSLMSTHDMGCESSNVESSIVQHSNIVSPFYIDNGDCNRVCQFCSAVFWYDERIVSASSRQHLIYNQCCKGGRVVLPLPRRPYSTIIHLFQQSEFMTNIRAYNSAFSMTSFGAKVDNTINRGSGPYVFKISGQIHHWLGSLCPPSNERPRFLQMYIYDTENEISNRLHAFTNESQSHLNPETVSTLVDILERCNELVKLFRTAKDLISSVETPSFSICLYGFERNRSYDRPSGGTLGAIISDGDPTCHQYDIVIRHKDDRPQRISKLHRLYMPLQYPLIFPYGDSGWSPDLSLRVTDGSRDKRLTVNMYYSYLLHDRHNLYTLPLRGGRLSQQFIVDAYLCIEENRLDYIRNNQKMFRTEFLQGIHDAVQRGDTEGRDIGKRTFLPSSFTGGPRYMYKHYQDALAICRVHGIPQYFITFTCNVKWPEIERYMSGFPSLKPQDRPDIIARVFQMKVKSLIKFLKTKRPFGEIVAYVYTIEFQKRGLPHCHLLLWVTPLYKIKDASEVDRYISAQIPDPSTDPHLYKIVTDLMIHGPCGLLKPTSTCMSSGTCSKNFPKPYQQETSFDSKGHVHYKRQIDSFTVLKGDVKIDNGFVVPYNRTLSLHFMAHINVEYCGWSMLIKYLFKYISKGADRVHYTVTKMQDGTNPSQQEFSRLNEIQNFLDGRFICPHEASWRIFNFYIHDRIPAVQTLAVHLENMQNITFRDNDHLDTLVTNMFNRRTTLTEWLHNNRHDDSGRHLRYIDYLTDEWRNLTFRATCEALGLLGDDKEWSSAIDEVSCWASASELRALFVQMLLYCDISNPLELFNKHWQKMGDDGQRTYGIANEDDLKQYVLYEVEFLLQSSPSNKSLKEYALPMPNANMLQRLQNKLLMDEKNYDIHLLAAEHLSSLGKLNPQQRLIYDCVMIAMSSDQQALCFVYGHGGTGKTFLWTTIIAALRSTGKIVLAVAASGIASLLLPSGRTTHSRFKIPLDMTDISTCNIKKNTQLAQLLKETSLIIWDEASMNDKKCFETLDRSLKDLFNNCHKPLGGKSVLLGGDFRQTLPIIPKASKATIMASSLPRSHLWPHFNVYRLTENIRLHKPNLTVQQRDLISSFSSWLVAVGDGNVGTPDPTDPEFTKKVRILSQYLIPNKESALMDLINFIYDDQTLQNPSAETLSSKAIVCPKNETVHHLYLV
ncbi:uncharacterized protein LOC143633361 [Bidens hawaiensis]|uniref:uncharacterized protein LOC143633361 n=1 Tax=Bidens hawaiensis TaxID=980011 RepID=UPI004049077A